MERSKLCLRQIPPSITLSRSSTSQNATLKFTSTFNFTTTTPTTPTVPYEGLGRQSLFLTQTPANGTQALTQVLGAIQNNGSAVADQLAFLAYSSKFLAGGWRFLTCKSECNLFIQRLRLLTVITDFGRDTLLALRLLLPVISQTSAEAILGAVIERTNSTGTLCHEETVSEERPGVASC